MVRLAPLARVLTVPVRIRIGVRGIVQGVGFRPFVHALAARHGLSGLVGNNSSGVFVEVEGPADAVDLFRSELVSEAPPLAVVEQVGIEEIPCVGSSEFVIVPSRAGEIRNTLISPDTATCADCLAELDDPSDRRFGHAFVNCTNCGPRFTIVTDVPYDRPTTTMAGFAMCPACRQEYEDPADRRFHAQPVCCPACGPVLRFLDRAGAPFPGDALRATVGHLRDGLIVAVKGIGGYHLATDAASERSVSALRARKHREDKPFALLVPDLSVAERICEVDDAARTALTSPRRPIVLLPRRPVRTIAESVAPGNSHLGVVLPYTAMHHRLASMFARPLVLTSGNLSDEPIAFVDDEARARLDPVADGFLTHDRPIHTRTDDSVVRIFRGREYPIRRSRGYVPQPLALGAALRRPILACGAELKNTFCLGKDSHAFVSHHIGDLENYETMRAYVEGIAHFQRLFDIEPELVVHDLHPEYLSTKHAMTLPDVDLIGVQHHHAHIASCLADNGVTGPVIGVAFDGLGYGPDETIWGGEFLRADLARYERIGHLEAVPMPGGTAAIKQPWRMAAAYLDAACPEGPPPVPVTRQDGWDTVTSLARRGLNSPRTSSAGRLFDAVAALIGVRDRVNYEGQAAIELEQQTDRAERDAYRASLTEEDRFLVRGTDLIRAAVDDVTAGVAAPRIAARFHNGLVDAVTRACTLAADRTGLRTVALSGGVWQNVLLLERVVGALEHRGFEVLTHSRVPCNDGGISLGQLTVAAALDR